MGPDYCHAHQCPTCKVVWFHDPGALVSDAGAHDKAHHCPACGTEQRYVSSFHTFHMTMYRAQCYDPMRKVHYSP